jgi:hypothetical protein
MVDLAAEIAQRHRVLDGLVAALEKGGTTGRSWRTARIPLRRDGVEDLS